MKIFIKEQAALDHLNALSRITELTVGDPVNAGDVRVVYWEEGKNDYRKENYRRPQ